MIPRNIRTSLAASNGVAPSVAKVGLRANTHDRDWATIVDRIQAGHDAGILELYSVLNRGIRYYLARQLGNQDLEDQLHEIFLIVVSAIRAGEVRQPERIMGFVRTVAQRQAAGYIGKMARRRRTEGEFPAGLEVPDGKYTPEEVAIIRQRAEIMEAALSEMPFRQREILQRYYLREESSGRICLDMSLTETQFRLAKSRAKSALSVRTQIILQQRSVPAVKIPA